MRKNFAGQVVAAQLVAKLDGSAVTSGTTTVYVTVDGGTQATTGAAVHEGQGCWTYTPTQAETNGNHVAFTFVNSNACPVTVNVYPASFDPTDAVRLGLSALPNAAAGANGGLPTGNASGQVAIQSGTGSGQLSVTSGVVAANVTQFGGAAGTFASGRPEVNASHWGGTAVASANVRANIVQVAGQTASAAAGVTFPASIGTSTYAGADTSGTATLLTRLSAVRATALDNLDASVSSRLASASYVAAPGAGAVADAVWDEARADHAAAGSFGEALDARVSDRATPDQVNAQLLDVLTVDTFTEISAVPPATTSILDILRWLYVRLRNKNPQTATLSTLRNDADTATIATAPVADDGTTTTLGKWTS